MKIKITPRAKHARLKKFSLDPAPGLTHYLNPDKNRVRKTFCTKKQEVADMAIKSPWGYLYPGAIIGGVKGQVQSVLV